jgi:cytochrome c peroxidase
MAPPSAAGSIFNAKARCNKCHALTDTRRGVVNFMDYDFHNIRI